ncbi:MAG: YIP1 family protein [Candidatus Binataceae bacterium]|jgi:hypothetical protein
MIEPGSAIDSAYVGILIRPRATIREVIDRDPRDKVMALVLINSLIGPIHLLIRHRPAAPTGLPIADKLYFVTIPNALWLILWPLGAILLLYLNGALIRWIGSLLGGTARAVEVRAALAWPLVFSIVTAPIRLLSGIGASSPLQLLPVWMGWVPKPWSLPAVGILHNLPAYWLWTLPTIIVGTPLWLWHLILCAKCIAEVHRFSAWRALAAWYVEYPVLFVLGGGANFVLWIAIRGF